MRDGTGSFLMSAMSLSHIMFDLRDENEGWIYLLSCLIGGITDVITSSHHE
jgi:hypothetical protein